MEAKETTTTPKPLHAIVFPIPLQGHVIPAVHLAIKLASKGFTITFVNTQVIHHHITKSLPSTSQNDIDNNVVDIFAGAREVGMDIRYRTVSDGFPLSFDRLLNHERYLLEDNREDIVAYIPGIKAIEPNDMPCYIGELDVSTNMHRVLNNAFESVKRADIILCNTVHELEFEPISAIQEKQPMFAIGPLFPSGFTNSLVPTSIKPELDCTEWLNSKLPKSVLYISFGSFVPCGKEEIDEIAHGLVLSKVNFIWVLRPDATSYEEPYVLPNGFENEVKGRGLIVTWTNQIQVISHFAIGGFLTHCGWNSVLESVWHGVPMLCFPLKTDQLTNRKLLVDDWRIGVNLCDKKPLDKFEVAEKINNLMCGKSSDELRVKITKVKEIIKNSLAQDGSSEKNLCQFIRDVKTKISGRPRM
ncbi:hypothetical protein F8388_011765 [Cannabis sativa]|uniref:Glycosyltransferase n=1 Tax=Cannabis sativa TaxID=3483 RepID=A0A7J6FGV7_CANSA|nr:hypothetical protein F8388_011765 [Cannabis sativa]